jgi:hypothetical protein
MTHSGFSHTGVDDGVEISSKGLVKIINLNSIN